MYYFNLAQAIIEGIFLVDLGFEFILEYTDEATNMPVRDIATISLRYLKGGFIEDAIPLIPWNWFVKFKYSRIFFLIKCFRLKETFDLLDTGKFMKQVKRIFEKKLDKICDDPELANNINMDQNKIMTIILFGYLFKTLKLVIVIFMVSYFLGIVFYIFCDITDDFQVYTSTKNTYCTEDDLEAYWKS